MPLEEEGAAPVGEVVYPTPWTNESLTSYFAAPDGMPGCCRPRAIASAAGATRPPPAGRSSQPWLLRIAESGPPPLGLHLLLPDFPRADNMLRG